MAHVSRLSSPCTLEEIRLDDKMKRDLLPRAGATKEEGVAQGPLTRGREIADLGLEAPVFAVACRRRGRSALWEGATLLPQPFQAHLWPSPEPSERGSKPPETTSKPLFSGLF